VSLLDSPRQGALGKRRRVPDVSVVSTWPVGSPVGQSSSGLSALANSEPGRVILTGFTHCPPPLTPDSNAMPPGRQWTGCRSVGQWPSQCQAWTIAGQTNFVGSTSVAKVVLI
jgi:hypothetical protein